mgnify:CR=1 FL=1
MIFDTLENFGRYRGLNENLDKAIDFFQKNPPRLLSGGRHEIDGKRAFCTRLECDLFPENQWEAHERHIDLHIALRDGETILCRREDAVDGWSELDPAVDAKRAKAPLSGARLPMAAGTFAVFFPWDAHCPQLGAGKTEKIIGKLAVEKP